MNARTFSKNFDMRKKTRKKDGQREKERKGDGEPVGSRRGFRGSLLLLLADDDEDYCELFLS